MSYLRRQALQTARRFTNKCRSSAVNVERCRRPLTVVGNAHRGHRAGGGQSKDQHRHRAGGRMWSLVAGGTSTLLAAVLVQREETAVVHPRIPVAADRTLQPLVSVPSVPNERVFTAEEVAEHSSMESGIWVSYRDGVYDVTAFVKEHPGGAENLLMAAGGPIDDFWSYWAYHHASPKVLPFLQSMRIGTLAEADKPAEPIAPVRDAFRNDPPRPADQIPSTVFPWSSETHPRAMLLSSSLLTPNDVFYVRNHAPVPMVSLSPSEYKVSLSSEQTGRHYSVSLESLQNDHENVSVTSVMQCAGNRSWEMIQEHGATAFSGTPYESLGVGMMGCAIWKGPRLAAVIKQHFPEDVADPVGKHVVFEGLDGYSTSTPLEHIIAADRDVLLAHSMNHVNLPPDHGYPLRVVLPGLAGARNVKWLTSLRIQKEEANSPWNSTYYRNKEKNSSIQGLPMQSLFLNGRKDSSGSNVLEVEGVAWGGGAGSDLHTVEVSADNGRSWKKAELHRNEPLPAEDQSSHRWAWTRWSCKMDLSELKDQRTGTELLVRAIDDCGRTQPRANFTKGGYLYNGWHKIRV